MHETAFDYLAGCRLTACVRAREERVRRYCGETGRPLHISLIVKDLEDDFMGEVEIIARTIEARGLSYACRNFQHTKCSGWYSRDGGSGRDNACGCPHHA